MSRYLCATCKSGRIYEESETPDLMCRRFYNGIMCLGTMAQPENKPTIKVPIIKESSYGNRPYSH